MSVDVVKLAQFMLRKTELSPGKIDVHFACNEIALRRA